MTKRSVLSKQALLLALLLAIVLPAAVLAQPPIDWWKFDETTGTIAYNSIPGRADGTLTSGAAFVPGISGNAVSLPPFESVNFPFPTGNLGTSDFTISFWLRTTGDGIGNGYSPFADVLGNRGAEGSASTPFIDFRMGREGNLALEVTGYGGSGYVATATDPGAGAVNDANWHLVSAVRQGPQIQIYLDGVLRATATAGDSIVADVQSPYEFAAGANDDTFIYDIPFTGTIDGLQIYDRALSAFEVQTPVQKLSTLISTIAGYGLDSGTENALTKKVVAALADLENGQAAVAINVLEAFINQCNAQSGKALTTEQADELIALAFQTISSLK